MFVLTGAGAMDGVVVEIGLAIGTGVGIGDGDGVGVGVVVGVGEAVATGEAEGAGFVNLISIAEVNIATAMITAIGARPAWFDNFMAERILKNGNSLLFR
ncbi:hypothetical protein A3J19_00405 [Candidatus Daviesbacteria bacterium RIFCSPLOWO2_02_FULL_41_8]|uniref:Uncharacterized protein n=3 Tax=Candidatus Daviesiibacteriota TaxID=1752718 RepID=A0A1F5NH83_9BACT|nr:MAG: hypothetical protein A2871_02750 [Candidatus Daviesbacteria bacterium RIFCSPHIGHO2_01_FULL_41_23]OGE33829.1 MAG: hypothetical protein A3D83_04625 [Candidatus Daviesbacteria bacterium RIFCSPHIGHO2_02_FULL_41_10]OGE62096.1 MAG: hypothetical protein A2967_00365 [Candidatus Daviesbacteria bacterium RIFCSPLOWO2_01_FULL_41_32]OGE76862.1 MAG: hypothetical protein A3J19_00405 [Candidatus Daviesbacteria bacterium RIFCSPLOWO2_02_FULL_41_8]